MDIIKALKENERPFGLMSEEMRAKAKEVNRGEFSVFWPAECAGGWSDHAKSGQCNTFVAHMSYRLRENYEEPEAKPDIVECEVYGDAGGLYYNENTSPKILPYAVSNSDFIGFKYYGTETSYSRTVMYNDSGILRECASIADIESGKVTPVRPTHVLFKGGK